MQDKQVEAVDDGALLVVAAARSRARPARYALSVMSVRGVCASRWRVAATVAVESAVTWGTGSRAV
jgi:hypothetical protein